MEAAGRIQYRPHNADRSERGLLNILPRTLSLASPSEGKAKSGRVARLTGQTGFAPNTENFSAVHNISVVCLTRLARSPEGLGGRSRIEFIVSPLPRRRHNESHFAAQSPERSFFFPLFLSPEKEKEVIGGDAVAKSLSVKLTKKSTTRKDTPHDNLSIPEKPQPSVP